MKKNHLRIVKDESEERRKKHNDKVIKSMNQKIPIDWYSWGQQVAILVVAMLIVNFILRLS